MRETSQYCYVVVFQIQLSLRLPTPILLSRSLSATFSFSKIGFFFKIFSCMFIHSFLRRFAAPHVYLTITHQLWGFLLVNFSVNRKAFVSTLQFITPRVQAVKITFLSKRKIFRDIDLNLITFELWYPSVDSSWSFSKGVSLAWHFSVGGQRLVVIIFNCCHKYLCILFVDLFCSE